MRLFHDNSEGLIAIPGWRAERLGPREATPRHEPALGLLQFSVPESGTGTTAGLGMPKMSCDAKDNAVKGGWEPWRVTG